MSKKRTPGKWEHMTDEKRLLWLARESGIDGFGARDLHEMAYSVGVRNRHQEPTDDDYVAAMRELIDYCARR